MIPFYHIVHIIYINGMLMVWYGTILYNNGGSFATHNLSFDTSSLASAIEVKVIFPPTLNGTIRV